MYKLLKSDFFEEGYIDWTNVLAKAAQPKLQPPSLNDLSPPIFSVKTI